jgi:hypothetical protein
MATREVNGKTVRYVSQQRVGEYETKVISFKVDPESEDLPCSEAVYQVSTADGKVIPGAVVEYFRPNFYVGGVLTGTHHRVFSEAVYAAVEKATTKPPRRPRRKPASKGAE